MRTCVTPEGRFVYTLHEPAFRSVNLREDDFELVLGRTRDGRRKMNRANFPAADVQAESADAVFEVANPLPFRGTTYIGKAWADGTASDPTRIAIASPLKVSMEQAIQKALGSAEEPIAKLFAGLPVPIKLALATTSTDPNDLRRLAESCCQFTYDEKTGAPDGLVHITGADGRLEPVIFNRHLFEAVANNPYLDRIYKEVMVLRPGIQGDSEIVGQWKVPQSHVFEYLRRNSYIPWGHYAANMAHDTIRYAIGDLCPEDIFGMRHLYYQRVYVQMAGMLGIDPPQERRSLSVEELDNLRRRVARALAAVPSPDFNATLWGWNYGFDYAPSGFRLHASHQQIHQQFALVPSETQIAPGLTPSGTLPSFACGDMVYEAVRRFEEQFDASFFDCYEAATRNNTRMDGRANGPARLLVYEDDRVMLFVPKAQTSQWELQMMPVHPVGNILEADTALRRSLDKALLIGMRVLARLGATMITVFEYNKRFHYRDCDQRLLYTFLPRLPESPGAFSESQLRWINGHYPEDFALACRLQMEGAIQGFI